MSLMAKKRDTHEIGTPMGSRYSRVSEGEPVVIQLDSNMTKESFIDVWNNARKALRGTLDTQNMGFEVRALNAKPKLQHNFATDMGKVNIRGAVEEVNPRRVFIRGTLDNTRGFGPGTKNSVPSLGLGLNREQIKEEPLDLKRNQTMSLEIREVKTGSDELLLIAKEPIDPSFEKYFHVLEDIVATEKKALKEERVSKLAEAIALSTPPSPLEQGLEEDQAFLRAQVYDQIPVYISEDIHRLSEAKTSNRASTANKWRTQGKIFGYKRGRTFLFPRFQFKDGKPRPIIKKILETLPNDFSEWQTIFWFMAPTGHLSYQRPMDCLDETQRVLSAAQNAGSVPVG